MLFHRFSLGLLATNCYLLADENKKTATIIDAPADADTILAFLKEHDYTLSDIVLTHGHFDHILALRELKDATGATVSIHENGVPFLADGTYNLCGYVRKNWTPFTPDRLFKDGDILSLGGENFQVLHTPGHTSDSVCFYDGNILLSGDTLFLGSIGRTDHPTGDTEQEINSILEKLMPLPDETPVYPGHGPSTTIGKERKGNPYLQ